MRFPRRHGFSKREGEETVYAGRSYDGRGVLKEVVCRFHANLPHSQEGYYRMETIDGEFLGNVDEGELGHELSVLEGHGYWISHVISS